MTPTKPSPLDAPLDELLRYSEPWFEAVSALMASPLMDMAERLHRAAQPYVGHSALVIFTEECTGRPQKKAGDESVIARVTIGELDSLRSMLVYPEPFEGEALIAGELRTVFASLSETNAMLVLTEPAFPSASVASREAGVGLLGQLWRLTALRIREKVSEAPPAYLVESRAASAERARITAELTDQHSTTLETLLAALRSATLDDAAARRAVTDLAAAALVQLRTASDRTISMIEEPVASAFERLKDDLRPLVRFSGIDVQFVEPPAGGRALPGEIAHAARAVVRGLTLAMVEQPRIERVRVQWDCDGENLLINVRDDGAGQLSGGAAGFQRVNQRVAALGGRMAVSAMPGWGSDVSVVMPLDPPSRPVTDANTWHLARRELEVLQLLTEGKRNRTISIGLGITENTVKFHVRNVFRKMGVSSRAEAITLARDAGIR
ncbi:LuxR C-terminal-related transcriptional regulator [Pseudarthrobacter sp. N5]|uniref:helix-turn-helix transcriptional regulator n=1 Tax=Pseudarthrobacter sp. N5 TaxID=3418416 RepID=UPI003CEFC200